MNVYICSDHDVHFVRFSASVVIANSEDEARAMLRAELISAKLNPDAAFTLEQIPLDEAKVLVFQSGDY